MSQAGQPPAPGQIAHRTMAEYALEQLRESIILGELPAGTPLRLDELARSLGMSISPIREAVRQLESLGLAKHVPHQGAKVLDFDIDELRGLFLVRVTLHALSLYEASRSDWLVALIRPAWVRSERFRPALLTSTGEAQQRHRGFDERLLAGRGAHAPTAPAG